MNSDRAIFESHQKYVDIQWTISGAEGIGYLVSSELESKISYNEKSDVEFSAIGGPKIPSTVVK